MTAHVIVDANVFLSFLVDRNEKQRASAKVLLERAGEGKIVAAVPQFVIFEVTYVLQSFYGVPLDKVATIVRDLLAVPGVTSIDDCPWPTVFELWPAKIEGMADAAIIAVALAHRTASVATFDRKMIRRMRNLGVESYW